MNKEILITTVISGCILCLIYAIKNRTIKNKVISIISIVGYACALPMLFTVLILIAAFPLVLLLFFTGQNLFVDLLSPQVYELFHACLVAGFSATIICVMEVTYFLLLKDHPVSPAKKPTADDFTLCFSISFLVTLLNVK